MAIFKRMKNFTIDRFLKVSNTRSHWLMLMLFLFVGVSVQSQSLCENGFAGTFPCERFDLLAQMSNSDLMGTGANDVWGWKDPVTGTEYALVGERQGLAMVDLSDPYAPFLAAFMETQTSSSTWRDMKVYADHVYVVSEANGHGLQVLDLNQLRDLTEFPVSLEPTTVVTSFSDAHNVIIDEESAMLYVVGTNIASGGLVAFDLSNPASPMLMGDYGEAGYTHDAHAVIYQGPDVEHQGKSLVFGANANKLAILDATDPTDIASLSISYYSDLSYTHQCWLTEDHRYLLLGDELDEQNQGFNTRTLIWDVQDLENPFLLGEHFSEVAAIDHNQYVVGNLLFQSNYRAGLRMLSLTYVAEGILSEIGYFDVDPNSDAALFSGTWSNFPYFESGLVVVTSIEGGIYIVRPRFMHVEAVNDSVCSGSDLVVAVDVLEGLLPPYTLSIPDLPDGVVLNGFPSTLEGPESFAFSISGLDAIEGSLELRIRLESALNTVEEPLAFTVSSGSVWYPDEDGDGYGNGNAGSFACAAPEGFVSNDLDCFDGSATIYPDAPELCDNLDNNCNQEVDEGLTLTTFYADADEDGFGSASSIVQACVAPSGFVANNGDCNDASEAVFPGASGTSEGLDNDCNGLVEGDELANCPGDFNLDGSITVADLLTFLGDFGCITNCMSDFDGDGVVNVSDLLGFLAVFGEDCPEVTE
jgi:choice-of-anchor B domain-containing protein